MLYESYQQKIEKLAAFKKKLRAYRALIITIAAVIFVLLTGFLSARGMVYYVSEVPEQLEYGQELNISAKALFNKVSYEFAKADSDEFSPVQPRTVGKYKVRAVSRRTFGIKSYSSASDYIITPKTLTVTSESQFVQYGDMPSAAAEGLVYGDTIYCSQFDFEYILGVATPVTPDKDSTLITDTDGNDVTSSYIISTAQAFVTTIKRNVTISVTDKTKVYDAKPFTGSDYSVDEGSIVAGDKLHLDFDGTITNVGSAKNSAIASVNSPQNKDISEFYDIKVNAGKLTVTKRPLKIATYASSKIYDGTPLSNAKHDLSHETPLVDTHNLILDSAASITDVGNCENLLTFRVMSGENDMSGNYSFEFDEGINLSITPRSITIKTDSDSKIYDGTALYKHSFVINSELSILDNHSLTLDFEGTQTNAGKSDNKASGAVVKSGETDLSANYEIEIIFGSLEVERRQISVLTATSSLIYNGKEQSDLNFTVTSPQGLANSHIITANSNSITTLKNVGNTSNILTAKINDSDGIDVTSNYIVNHAYGILSIVKRNITVTITDVELEYNGKYQSSDKHTFSPALPANQQSKVQETVLVKARDVEFDDGGEVKIYDNSFYIKIFDGTEDVSDNYNITYGNIGKLKIVPCRVKVSTEGKAFVYNGLPQTHGVFTTDLSADMKATHTASITTVDLVALTEVEKIADNKYKDNVFEVSFYRDGDNIDYNFDITYSYGKLYMTPCPITVKTSTNSWVYDGTEYFDTNFNVLTDLCLDHTASVDSETVTTITNVGSKENKFTVSIYSGANDVSHNYAITYSYGTLTITPRPITIETATNIWIYDGEWHYDEDCWLTSGTLVLNHETVVTANTKVRDIVYNEPNVLKLAIFDGTINVTYNYNITYINGTLTITKLDYFITTATTSKVYDGEPHYDKSYTVDEGVLLNGHELVIFDYTTITNVGTVLNILRGKIMQGNTDVTHLYNLVINYGTLSVTPRPITVRAASTSKEYDGTSLRATGFSVVGPYQIVDGQYTRLTCNGSQTEIGSSDNTIVTFNIFFGNDDVTYNYDITYLKGTLTVTTRRLEIEANSASKFYDGTELTRDGFTYKVSALLAGHFVTAIVYGSQTEVGYGINYIENIKITNIIGEDVSHFYNIIAKNGSLHIYKAEITVMTGSAERENNGTPLTCNYYEASGDLLDGHVAVYTVTGIRYTVGTSANTIKVEVFDRNNDDKDVTDYYNIIEILGTLTITGTGGFTGDIDGSGSGGGQDPPTVMFRATSDISGSVYFRARSFGDYNTQGWNTAPVYSEGDINALMLSYLALANSNSKLSTVQIEMVAANMQYLLPYYANSNGYRGIIDDTILNTSYPNPYSINYISYTYDYTKALSLAGTGYEEFEKEYYDYVQKTYLQLPATTKAKMLEIAAQNGLSASSPSIINEVASFVQNKVKYSFDFSYEGDYAVYFFTVAKTGICQHYATAATTMLRALGFPARYTAGYVGKMSAGKTVDVTNMQGHAWVEVYLKGIGWIQLEVTGSGEGSGAGGGGGSGGGGSGDGNMTTRLAIKPVDVYKKYDGTPLFAKKEIEGDDLDSVRLLEYLLSKGYYYTVSTTGSRTDYGVSPSSISDFLIYDSYAHNVTDDFEIEYKEGRIRITKEQIIINVYSLQKTYDGTPLEYQSNDYWAESLPAGYTLNFNLKGAITNAGMLKLSTLESLSFTLLDNNTDVTDNYSLIFKGKPMIINKRIIELTSGSSTKVYDGTALKNSSVWISKGYLSAMHRLEATAAGTITDIGTEKNLIAKIRIYDQINTDVTANYDIVQNAGTLRVI